jgi:PAS domain S-box-containing protein
MTNTAIVKDLLTIFASRAAAELERARAEQERIQALADHRNIMETIPDVLFTLDLVGSLVRWNHTLERVTGYSAMELLNKHALEFVPPAEHEPTASAIQRAFQDGYAELEGHLLTKDGRAIPYHWTGARLHDPQGRVIGLTGVGRDIAERKRTEALLWSSQEKLQQALHASNTGLWDWNTETDEVSFSREWKRQLGYDEDDLPNVFETWESRLHPEDRARTLAYVRGYLAHPEDEYRQEFRLRHKDGSYRWIEARASVITEPDGRRVRLLGSHTDITARKHAEEALHISQGRYARATAVGKVGVWELDAAIGSYHGDANLKALFGYEEDELSTDPSVWLNLVHPDDQAIAMQSWQRIVTGEIDHYSYELRMIKKDGMVIWTDVRGHAVRSRDGQVTNLFGATVDITERKRTEQVLRERETALARFKATLDQVHDCVFMFAADSLYFVYCNRGAVMQVGYTENELATMTPLDIKPEFTERTFREMLQPLRDGSRAVQIFETVHRHRDGHDVAVEVSLQFVAEAGESGRFVAVVRDITERKQAQETLRLSEERFRSLFENSPIAYQSLDREGRFIDVNQRLCHLLGYDKEELIGSNFGDLWAGDAQGAFTATFEAFKKSGKVRNELALRRRDGTIINAVIDGRIQRDQNGEFIRTHCILTDITERAQAEIALRGSEARFKEAQRIAHIGSWELDLVTNRLTWSDEIYRIFEIDTDSFGDSYEAFLQLVHPDDRSLVNRAYTESVTTRTPYNITHRLLMADGRIKFVREQCETQYGRDGLPLRSNGTVQDITKQKEAEEALAQNHALLTAIMDASIDFIYIKDLQGRYVHINRAGAEAVGMSAESVIGWDDVALWGGELAASRCTSDRFVTASGHTVTVEERGTLLGNIADYLTTKAPYRDSEGRIIGVIGIARNITEWKQVEEERQKALTLLTNVINATPDLIFVKDRNLRTILCNNSFAQALGKTPEDVIGRPDIENGWDLELVRGNPDAGILGYELDDREALTGKVVHNPSDPANVNGEVRIFDTYKVPLRDETGGVVGVLGVSRDVTEHKRMEEILRQRERDLRAAVEERERISEDLHDGILQSIFAVGLGLESCRTLVSELPLPRKQATAPLMAALNRAIGQLNHVMTDVRHFIAGIESHVLEEADIAETLRTMVQAMCASNGTPCRVTIEEAAVREISTEEAYHVMNVMREALSNSIRHSGAGRITLSFKRLRRSVRLSVTDNGKGFIPDSVRDVGHGLINMAARARKLGGRIEVRSRPRRGTKVLLDIPRRPVDE